RVLDLIQAEGACYAQDIQRSLGLSLAELDGALVQLLLQGLITNDDLKAMRIVIEGAYAQPAESRGIESSLDAQLAAWRARRQSSAPGTEIQRPAPGRLRRARRQASRRVAAETPYQATGWRGRWALVQRDGLLGPSVSETERAERLAWQLLERYGILCRECVENEEGDWGWSELYRQLQIMELRGSVRRGYFVRGLSGVQFALPEAVEQLRAWNRPEAEGADELVLLNAWDPALLYGPALGGRERDLGAGLPEAANPYRFARLPSNYVVLLRGAPALLYEHGGQRWTALPGLGEETLRAAISMLLEHLTREGGLCAQPPRVLVASWNGVSPLGSEAEALLTSLGFRREALTMVWDGL
ncbi:MAG: hypothetical protein JXA74_10910, partial [Anaerolineae bacterium]|nr:hypothetical protein [Anaerolineae bacterium]